MLIFWVLNLKSTKTIYVHAAQQNTILSCIVYRTITLCMNMVFILTYPGRGKCPPFSRRQFQNAFSWRKMCDCQLQFHWRLFLRVQLKVFNFGPDNGLAPTRWQGIIWTYDDLVYRRIFASLGPDEFQYTGFRPTHSLIPNRYRCFD